MIHKCKVCGNTENNTFYTAREMMFGYRDEFEYFQCAQCECLQIAEVPQDLGKYYPSNYHSYQPPKIKKASNIIWMIKRLRTHRYLTGKGVFGGALIALFGPPQLPRWVKPALLGLDSKILDIGCGAGSLLVYFQGNGFSNLTGFDPYIKEDIHYDNGVRIVNKDISKSNQSYDFVMLHHSFEHMEDPRGTLKNLCEAIMPDGRILIRIPLASSYAWNTYKTNWIQLDAPRHLFLHSIKSMKILAKSAGLEIQSIEFDSSAFQLWGSEQYLQDIPFRDPRSYRNGIDASIFTEEDIKRFENQAEQLNLDREGDQAWFLLRKDGNA